MQIVVLDEHAHRALLAALGGAQDASANLDQKAESIVLEALRSEAKACQAGAMDDDARGRVWLEWRPLRSLAVDGARGFLAALACADTMCGPEPMVRERLAYLNVGRERSTVTLIGDPPSALNAYERARVDSVAVLAGDGFLLVQARRRFDNDHPCIGVVDAHAYEEACFIVLAGGRVRQAFALVPSGTWGNHDDVDGDAALARRGELRVGSEMIELRYRVDEALSPASGDSSQTTRTVIGRGVVHLRRNAKTGRFVRSN